MSDEKRRAAVLSLFAFFMAVACVEPTDDSLYLRGQFDQLAWTLTIIGCHGMNESEESIFTSLVGRVELSTWKAHPEVHCFDRAEEVARRYFQYEGPGQRERGLRGTLAPL